MDENIDRSQSLIKDLVEETNKSPLIMIVPDSICSSMTTINENEERNEYSDIFAQFENTNFEFEDILCTEHNDSFSISPIINGFDSNTDFDGSNDINNSFDLKLNGIDNDSSDKIDEIGKEQVLTLTLGDGEVVHLQMLDDNDMENNADETLLPSINPKEMDSNNISINEISSTSSSEKSNSSVNNAKGGRRRPKLPSLSSLRSALANELGPNDDLCSLIKAAKINLNLDEIVSASLSTLKRRMGELGLSQWQITLCIKIRRRSKNTAAVRSSRRRRSQYVSELNSAVSELEHRRDELREEQRLLRQLHQLWQRLRAEVRQEIDQAQVEKGICQDNVDHYGHAISDWEQNQDESSCC